MGSNYDVCYYKHVVLKICKTLIQIDVSKVDLSAVTPEFFVRPKKSAKKGEEAFFKKVCFLNLKKCYSDNNN